MLAHKICKISEMQYICNEKKEAKGISAPILEAPENKPYADSASSETHI